MSVAPPQTDNRPALGAYINTPETEEAKDRMRWMYQMSRIDHRERTRAYDELVGILQQVRTGRRLDIVADQLVVLAARLDDVIQLHAGGWPISYRRMPAA